MNELHSYTARKKERKKEKLGKDEKETDEKDTQINGKAKSKNEYQEHNQNIKMERNESMV